ncbi:hypothetical protein, partial [Citreimonas sp.]|uniref:hypothetical protein n=1 Tax=Citreimonas sp. TaxID=3036715 RepID=UPI004058A799
MTERRVVYRVGIDGGQVVKREFDSIGKSGELSHERIVEGARAASRESDRLERAIASERRAFQSLKASVDPVYAAEQRLARVQEQLNRAVSMGVVGQREAAQVMRQVETRARGVASAMELTDTATRAANGGLRNTLLQVNQIGQQAAATGNFMGAVAIQLPDILGGLGGIAPLVLGAAAGLGAAFIPRLFEAGDAADDLESDLRGAFNEARSAIDEAEKAQNRYTLAISATGAMQGQITPQILEALKLEANARMAIADLEIIRLEQQRRAVSADLDANEKRLAELKADAQEFAEIGTLMMTDEDRQRRVNAAIQEVLADNQALVMTIREQEAELQLVDAQLALVSEETQEVLANLEESAKAAEGLRSVDIESGILSAAQAAFVLSQRLSIGLDLARRIASFGPQGLGDTPEKGGRGGDPREFGGSTYDWRNREAIQFLEDYEPPKDPSRGRGGRGGGGRSKALSEGEREAERVMREVEKATLDAMSATERYQHEVRELRELHDEGYLSAEQYGRAVEMMTRDFEQARIDEVRKGIEGLTEQLLRAGLAGEGVGQVLRDFLFDAAIKAAAEELSNSLAQIFAG